MTDDIVIVGMACRYPDADDPAGLWQNVLSRRRSFRPFPAQRLPLTEYGGDGPDLTSVTHAAVLENWDFDRARFRVPGSTFRAVDLTHWLALEVSAAALADAGLPDGDGTDRGQVGVVLGNSLTGEFSRAGLLRTRWPYVRRTIAEALRDTALSPTEQADLLSTVERSYKAPFPVPSDETLAGGLANTIAGRICNHFDFQGSGYTVDGACASSLIAVSTAAEAVASGQLEVALAGGVDLSLDPFEMVGFARVGALAEDQMRVYDARPTGFLPGEGCGVVVLCRRSYADRAGLRPYARLLGWGISSDGSGGLTRPELAGQRLALRRAYSRAELDPGLVGLVEGHGTGTAVGDETELRTLLEARESSTAEPGVLGSIKANIGHTKAAAGVAGLIKATLAVYHEILPPTTGCAQPHPLLTDPGAALRIGDAARAWLAPRRYASVSAMGFGGINAHLVLGGATPSMRRGLSWPERRLAGRHPGREVVVCAAESVRQLADTLASVRDAVRLASRGELTDLAGTLAATHRGRAPVRFAAAVASPAELVAAIDYALGQLAAGERRLIDPVRRVFLATAPLRVGLLFSGQAAPCYPDAGSLADLLDELPGGYADELPIPATGAVDTAVAQPAIVRASLAGLRWLDTLGVRAHAAVGHSLGELTALVWAGALGEAEASALATERGAAMSAASSAEAGMASLRTGLAVAEDLLTGTGAVIAADNAEHQVVISGERAEVARAVTVARQRGIEANWLPVRQAFHSDLMAPARQRLREAALRVGWKSPARPVASTITGGWWAAEDPVEMLVRQLTEPVRFREAAALLPAELLVELLIEVGPGQILGGLTGTPTVSMDCGARSDDGLATATAALFAAGAYDSAEPYFGRRFTRRFDFTHTRRFLTNPCEIGAVPASDTAASGAAATRVPAGRADTAGSGTRTPDDDPVAVRPDAEPIDVAVARIAAAVELAPAAIGPAARLLGDLHLTSLAVSQLATDVARDLGRALPAAPLTLATATVGEFASAIAALPTVDNTRQPAAGIASWVRALGTHLVPRPAPEETPVARRWAVVGTLAGHPLADAIRTAFPADPDGVPTRLLALPPGLGTDCLDDVLAALRDSDADRVPLTVLHHGGFGAAVGRSLVVENPAVPVSVLEVPAGPDGIGWAAAEAHRPWQGYAEVVFSDDGVRRVPVVRPMEVSKRRDGEIPLRAGEVCLISGGAKGIGVECGAALARATGARIALLGRAAGDDPQVRAAIARVASEGAEVSYHRVDVTDAAAVRDCVAELERGHGPVRGLLHAAGFNQPARIAELTVDKMRAVLAPKVSGLDNLLSALDTSQLRVGVTFGSVIGRTGLAGEADYAIANEWLARRCAELTAAGSATRWFNIEWSAWAGTGMGVRLGVLDALIRQGVAPIPVEDGVDMLLRLLATPALPPTVVVAGRLPVTPTLAWDDDVTAGGARFLQSRQSHTPGVELVADADLSLGSDPYLADHRIDGTAVLPAVFGLEAMAQACVALGAKPIPAMFTDVALTRPITVPERANRVLRVAALVREGGGLDVVARSEETGFAVDHFRARYAEPGPGDPLADAVQLGRLVEGQPLYGPLFFHGPRFERVRGYHGLSAYRCTAAIAADPDARWFGAFHDQRLELGDPGARDAFLHALQACVPDRRVLPVAVERITVYRRPEGSLTLHGRQRDEDAHTFLFDLAISDAGRSVVEEWQGVRLRDVGPLPVDWRLLPIGLLGPFLARSLRRWQPQVTVDLAVAPARRTDRHRTAALAAWLSGDRVEHAPDGRLLVAGTGAASASHLDGQLLVAAGPKGVAVDWERVGPRMPLDHAAGALATELVRGHDEDEKRAACRAWTCREVLSKQGQPPDAPLILEETGPGGWIRVGSGAQQLYSVVVDTADGAVAVCVGCG